MGSENEIKSLSEMVEEYRKDSELFNILFETAPTGQSIAGIDGVLKRVNPALCQMMGYSCEDLLGKTYIDITHPEDRNQSMGFVKSLLKGESNRKSFEKRYIKKGGETLWCQVTVELVRDAGGRGVCFIAYQIDITDKKRLESSLEDREFRFSYIMKKAPIPLCFIDSKKDCLFCNDKFEETFGYKSLDFQEEEDWWRFAYPDRNLRENSRQSWKEAVKVAKETETIIEPLDCSITSKSGENKAMKVSGAVFDEALLVTFVDNRHSKDMEACLEEIVTELKLIHEQVPIAILLVDENCVIYRGNGTATTLANLRPNEITGKSIGDVLGCKCHLGCNKDNRCEICSLMDVVNATFQYQKGIKDREIAVDSIYGGHIKTQYYQVSTSYISLNKRPRVLVCLQDITSRKEEQKEKALLEEKLGQAQKMEAVGRLAGGVAHDFNNMLCVILGFTDMAMKDMDTSSPAYRDLKDVKDAAVRSAELTRQLLTFSRRQVVSPVVLDLNKRLVDMKRMLERILGEDINFELDLADAIWPVKIDPGQFDQIIANMAVNARDAMMNGGTLTIRTSNYTIDDIYFSQKMGVAFGDYVVIDILDTGAGISDDIMEHIFEPFFTTKTEGKGTGLGLATVYGIVDQNKGFINVYSEAGMGASFKVHLPKCFVEQDEPVVHKEQEVLPKGSETILVVEDEDSLRRLTSDLLISVGYKVYTAESGEKALKIFEEHQGEIDLVLADVVMGGINGLELCEKIQDIDSSTKVMFMSGYTGGVTPIKIIIEKGMFLLQKPFSYRVLLKAVRNSLDGKKDSRM